MQVQAPTEADIKAHNKRRKPAKIAKPTMII